MSQRVSSSKKPSQQFLTLKEASLWAGNFLKREISESNISYLIQSANLNLFMFGLRS